MTDITKLAQSLKVAADNAGADYWQAKRISGDFYVIRKGSYKRECGYTTYQPIAEIDHKPTRDYVAMANPTNILALVEALEKAQGMEAYWKTQCRGITDHCEELQARIAELESRTVKLPKPHAHLIWIQAGHAPDDYWDDVAVSHSEKDRCCDGSERYPVYARWEIEEALTAAGIKVEAE
ncbi:hypothetical protein ACXQFH_003623 [Klebsiella pneumoniae]